MKDRAHDTTMAEVFCSDQAYAVELLNSILEDGKHGELLIALRQMAEVFGGVRGVANLPPLSDELKAEIKALIEMLDSEKSIHEYLGDLEDLYIAEQRLIANRTGKSQTHTLEEVMKSYGMGRADLDSAAERDLGNDPLERHPPNKLTSETLAKSERGEDVHHAKDAADLFNQLGI